MIREALAVLVLMLVASPLTAPFQTWRLLPGAESAAAAIPDSLSPTSDETVDPSWLVSPLRTLYKRVALIDLKPGIVVPLVDVPRPGRSFRRDQAAPAGSCANQSVLVTVLQAA